MRHPVVALSFLLTLSVGTLHAQAERRAVRALAVPAGGAELVAGRADGTIEARDRKTGAVRREWKAHEAGLEFLVLHPDGKRLLSHGAERAPDGKKADEKKAAIKVWDLATGKELSSWTGVPLGVLALAVHPKGAEALTGCWSGEIARWDLEKGTRAAMLRERGDRVRFLAYLGGGERVLEANEAGDYEILDAAGWKRVAAWGPQVSLRPSLRDYVRSYALAADGKRALSAGNEMFRIWNVDTRKEVGPWKPGPRGMEGRFTSLAVAVSPDGRGAASIGDHALRLVDLRVPRLVADLFAEPFLTSVAFTADGKQVVTGCGDGRILLWDPARGKPVATWK